MSKNKCLFGIHVSKAAEPRLTVLKVQFWSRTKENGNIVRQVIHDGWRRRINDVLSCLWNMSEKTPTQMAYTVMTSALWQRASRRGFVQQFLIENNMAVVLRPPTLPT